MPLILEKDSVFSPVLALFAEKIPYEDDEPILPRKEIENSLDSIENDFASRLFSIVAKETDKLLKKLDKDLEGKNTKAITKAGWNVFVPLQREIAALWDSGWNLGQSHSIREVDYLRKEGANFSTAEFADDDVKIESSRIGRSNRRTKSGNAIARRGVELPKDQESRINSLTKAGMQQAVDQRAIKLARDVDDTTLKEIKGHMLAYTDPNNPIDRRELEKRINLSLGRQAGREAQREVKAGLSEAGNASETIKSEQVRTKNRIPGNRGFLARARMIASTELAASYSTSKLQAYQAAGITRVRWQSLEDLSVCQTCRSRNGTVHNVSDLLLMNPRSTRAIAGRYIGVYDARQYLVPAHPICRCSFVPVLEGDEYDTDQGRRPDKPVLPLPGKWIAAAGLGLAGIYATIAVKNKIPRNIKSKIGDKAQEIAKTGQNIASALKDIKGVADSLKVNNVDINKATLEQLKSLGLTTRQANAVIKKRDSEVFKSLDDLRQVKGIGDSAIEKLRFAGLKPDIRDLRTPEQIQGVLGVSRKTAEEILRVKEAGISSTEDLLKKVNLSEKVKQNLKAKLDNVKVSPQPDDAVPVRQKVGSTPATPINVVKPSQAGRKPKDILRDLRSQAFSPESAAAISSRVDEQISLLNDIPRVTKASRDNLRSSRDSLRSIQSRIEELENLRSASPNIFAVSARNRIVDLEIELRNAKKLVSNQATRFDSASNSLGELQSNVRRLTEEIDAQMLSASNMQNAAYVERLQVSKNKLSRLTEERMIEKQAHVDLIDTLQEQIKSIEAALKALRKGVQFSVWWINNLVEFGDMYSLSEIAEFARKKGSKDKGKRKRKKILLGATGTGLIVGGLISNRFALKEAIANIRSNSDVVIDSVRKKPVIEMSPGNLDMQFEVARNINPSDTAASIKRKLRQEQLFSKTAKKRRRNSIKYKTLKGSALGANVGIGGASIYNNLTKED